MLNKANFIVSKKSEIGETLTWFVAFLLIFFIMILFTISCMAIAAGKGFTKDKGYTAQPVSSDIQVTENFISLLNEKSNNILVKDLIISWSKETDKVKAEELRKIISSSVESSLQKNILSFPCYDLTISLIKSKNNIIYVSNIPSEYTSTPLGPVPVYNPVNHYPRIPIYLSNGQESISIKFYQGACK